MNPSSQDSSFGEQLIYLNGMGGPEDGDPLIEGANPAWNPVLQLIPEDKRAEVVPILKEWDTNYNKLNESYSSWKEFQDGGVTPDLVNTAVGVYNLLENQPQVVYDALGKHLGITPKEAKKLVDETEENEPGTVSSIEDDPRFKTLAQQVDTLSQIALAQRQTQEQTELEKQQEAELNSEFEALKKKHGDFPEDEVIMRMITKDIGAEEALADYQSLVTEVQKRRPAPFVLSGGAGTIPKPTVDVRSLDNRNTKALVAQMLGQANRER